MRYGQLLQMENLLWRVYTNQDLAPEWLRNQVDRDFLKRQMQSRNISSTLTPYLEELKKAQGKKKAAEWKKMEKKAGVSSRVHADIKQHEVTMNYLFKRGEISKLGESG